MTNFRLNVLAYSVMLGLTAGVAYAAQPTNQQPTTNNQQPTTNNQQPTTNNQQPTTNNQQPTTKMVMFLNN
nr:putative hemoglobin and hemoglobin-haptoglobin-binding protein 2 precursor [Haemophilus influenzae]PRL89542.1 putative hemoglobin and hemoglobin-haptoglobin-binding protein 2 precursor [Haemophilus influenzae]